MGKARQYLAIVAAHETGPEWEFVGVDPKTLKIRCSETFKAHDPRALSVLERWEREGLRLGFRGSEATRAALLANLGGSQMPIVDHDILRQLKSIRPDGPWALLARCPRTGAAQEGCWAMWNRKSMERWIKLYEGLGYQILLPIPGTKILPPSK